MKHLFLALLGALTELQVDQIIRLIEQGFRAVGEGIKAVWVALSPIGIGYLMWRQAMNRKALDANTQVNKSALDAANGLTEKIANSTKLVEDVVTAIAKPQQVEVVNTATHPVSTQPVHRKP